MDVYTKYKPQGLEIFAFSTDTIQSKWKAGVRKHFTGWISVSDLKGTAGPLSRKYNVWYTPGFYFIDEKKKIIGKPMNIDYIDKQLELLLKK
jgi:peroxiredoxin